MLLISTSPDICCRGIRCLGAYYRKEFISKTLLTISHDIMTS